MRAALVSKDRRTGMTKLKGAFLPDLRKRLKNRVARIYAMGEHGRSRGTAPCLLNRDTNGSERSASHPRSDTREEAGPRGYVGSTAGLTL